ncbi:hypothetical protein ACFUTV_41100 [Streptomyces sp. NPDC057298]|uniref:hypothetical protein n=1 Tax=Streptomyces sp. NPDC057298 TaxID=3346091 RepID=UPI00363D1419
MSESAFEYRQARAEYGASCADSRDLTRYLARISTDTQSLRLGLAEAVTHVFGGTAAPSEGTSELPYPADRVERALFDDSMQSVQQLLVADPAVATALRHAMRLLEDAAQAAYLVRVLLERPDDEAVMERLTCEVDLGEDDV